MNASNRHIVQRQILEVTASQEEGAFFIQDKITKIYYNEVLPRLDELFSKYAGPGERLRIDRLQLVLPPMEAVELERSFPEKFLEAMEVQLQKMATVSRDRSNAIRPMPLSERSVFEQFLFFLHTGRNAWWESKAARRMGGFEAQLLELFQAHPERCRSAILANLRNDLVAVRRLVFQFSHSFLETVLAMMVGESAPAAPSLAKADIRAQVVGREKPPTGDRADYFYRQFISVLEEGPTAENAMRPEIDRPAAPGADERKNGLASAGDRAPSGHPGEQKKPPETPKEKTRRREIRGAEQERKLTQPPARHETPFGPFGARGRQDLPEAPGEGEALYCDAAGLVLVHPFLPGFFGELDLLGEEQCFRDERCATKAVHLLHFLATARVHPAESELLLPKLLSGWPLEKPIERFVELPNRERAEAEDLLAAVIDQWPALKNTDPPTFRDGFLQREGKLTRTDHGWKLIVEAKAQDVLLSRLPWGIGLIKLPWMAEMMMVDWT